MATKKLTDYDKTNLENHVRKVITAPYVTVECPVRNSKQWQAVLEELMPASIKEAIEIIKSNGGTVGRSYSHGLTIADSPYKLRGYSDDQIYSFMHTTHAYDKWHGPLLLFAEQTMELRKTIYPAERFICRVLQSCGTAGQVARVLPFLTGHLSHDAAESLRGAERNSRWPSKLPAAWDLRLDVDNLHSALALGSLVDRSKFEPQHLAVSCTLRGVEETVP